MISQHCRLRQADRDVYLFNIVATEVQVRDDVQDRIDNAVRGIADRILFDRQSCSENRRVGWGNFDRAVHVHTTCRRKRLQKASRVLKYIGTGRKPKHRQMNRLNPAGCGPASVHRPEVGDQPAGHGRGQAEGVRSDARRQPIQIRNGRGGRDRAKYPGRVPAFHVKRIAFARGQLRPHFVADDIGPQHIFPGRGQPMALSENRRHEDGARMRRQGDVVIVENVGGDAIDHRRVLAGKADPGKWHWGCVVGALPRAKMFEHDRNCWLVGASEHGSDAVHKPQLRDSKRAFGER